MCITLATRQRNQAGAVQEASSLLAFIIPESCLCRMLEEMLSTYYPDVNSVNYTNAQALQDLTVGAKVHKHYRGNQSLSK